LSARWSWRWESNRTNRTRTDIQKKYLHCSP